MAGMADEKAMAAAKPLAVAAGRAGQRGGRHGLSPGRVKNGKNLLPEPNQIPLKNV